LSPNKALALDGQGGLWVAGISAHNAPLLRRYTFSGNLVEEIPDFKTGWMSIATNIHDRAAGFIQDVLDQTNGVTKIEHTPLNLP